MAETHAGAQHHLVKARGFLEAARVLWTNGSFSSSICSASDAMREAVAGALAWRGANQPDSVAEAFRSELVATGLIEHDHHSFWEDLEADRRKVEEEFHRFTAAASKERLERVEAFIRRVDTLVISKEGSQR